GNESAPHRQSPGTLSASKLPTGKVSSLCQRVSLLWQRVRSPSPKSRDFVSEQAPHWKSKLTLSADKLTLSASPLPIGKVPGLCQRVSSLCQRVSLLCQRVRSPLEKSRDFVSE